MKDKIKRRLSVWYIWLFPALALLICSSLLFSYWQSRGPTIQIFFDEAASLQVEKTKVRFRGVEVGRVSHIKLSKDNRHAVVHVTLQRDAKHIAVEGSKFWLVTPKVDFQGVTGLETIFSGNYIAVDPGPSDGSVKLVFEVPAGNLSDESLENTVAYYLETKSLGSVGVGDDVSFRGLKIGSVSKINLNSTAQLVNVQVNIQGKFVRLIRTNTVFWRKVGIQANLGLFKSEIKINSLESLLRGGVEIFTPEPPGKIAKALSRFGLGSEPPKGWEKWNPNLQVSARLRPRN